MERATDQLWLFHQPRTAFQAIPLQVMLMVDDRSKPESKGPRAPDGSEEHGDSTPAPPPGEPLEDGETPRVNAHSVAVNGLLILAILYATYAARAFLLPIILALLLNFILRPVLGLLRKIHIPASIGAGLILLMLIGGTGFGIYGLSRPAAQWMGRAPAALRALHTRLRPVLERIEKFGKVATEFQQMAKSGPPEAKKGGEQKQEEGPGLSLTFPGLLKSFLTNTQESILSVVTTLVMLYFLLVYQDLFLAKMVKVIPRFSAKKRARIITRDMERQITRYLLTITVINCSLGLVLGTAFHFIGLPNAVLWGVAVALLNYVPYLGALTGIIIITFVAIFSFDALGHSLIAPAVYLAVAVLEGNFITPAILGRQFTLNPAVIFVWLVFWGWIWGIPGALLAVPMLTCVKILCDNLEPLANLGEFLGN